jgi:hypothetical protein
MARDAQGALVGISSPRSLTLAPSGLTPLTTYLVPADLKSLAITPPTATLTVGARQQLVAWATLQDGSLLDVTAAAAWTSTSPGVATSDAAGDVTAVGPGTAVVSATVAAASGSATITVAGARGMPTAPPATSPPSDGGAPASATLVALLISPMHPSVLLDAQTQLTATGTFSDGSVQDLTARVHWTSSAEGVASVGNDGVVTGKSAGTATIAASLGGVAASAQVTVASASLVSLAVTPAARSLPLGGTLTFVATGTFSDNSRQNLTAQVTWSSSSTSVANINSSGLATSTGQGTTTITATLGATSGSTSLTVTAPALVSIALTPAAPTVARGATLQLTATGTYSDQSTQDLTAQASWVSATLSVATVNRGLCTAVAAGTSNISATMGAITGSTPLTAQ